MAFLQSRLYKIKIICIFIKNNLHNSKKCNTFAVNLKNIVNR